MPAVDRRGIARELTMAAMQRAREKHAQAIWLHVRDDNPGAIELYRELGFVERTRRTNWQALSGTTPIGNIRANIRITPQGKAVLVDFGIAKATQGRLTDQTVFTAFEQFLGTPAYMSPEQAQLGGLDVDTRSDIYSLGVLLYELLTGRTPFDAEELASAGVDAMRRRLRETEPLRPSTRLARLGLEELTTTARRRATASTPSGRETCSSNRGAGQSPRGSSTAQLK